MFLVSHRATERGILARTIEARSEERTAILQEQRALYEAQIEEAEHIAEIKRVAADRAETMAIEMREMGYRYQHTYREIERRSCKLFNVKIFEIRSKRRNRRVVFARQFVMYWATRLTKLSLPQIGRLMGGRDHTTVLHGKDIYPEKRARMGRSLREAR